MLLCQDVLIDVCRFLTRQQLANAIAPLNRRCWLSLFQPGQPFHTYPCRVVDVLDIAMDGYFHGKKNNNYQKTFLVTTGSSGHRERSILLQLDVGDNRPSLLSDEAVTLPGHVRFKTVRVELMALLEHKQDEQPSDPQDHSDDSDCGHDFSSFCPITYTIVHEHPLPNPLVLDQRKLELLDALSANFRGATLVFTYLCAPFSYRIALSAFLTSDEFFGRFFGKFEAINFWGHALPIKDVPVADQPLLRLPGLMRHKTQLVFECEMTTDYMFDVDEIVEWLHYAGDGTNKERNLFINNGYGIAFRSQQVTNQWMENLTMELKKSLLSASKTQPYTLYIDGPMYNEVDTSTPTPSTAAVLATNYNTCEQLINEMHDPRQQGLPLGIEMGGIHHARLERLFEVFRRTKIDG